MIQVTGPYEIVPGSAPARNVRVYVPRRAAAEDRPLLLMFDGQNVFDDRGSFAGGWHSHRAVERLAKPVRAPVIVAIDHGHEHRISELSPFDFGPHRGRLEDLLGWVGDWLLARMRGEHRITTDPRRAVVAGSSMGGVAALYAAVRRPDLFAGAIVMSPSLFIARGAMFGLVAGASLRHTRVYIDGGAHEGRILDGAGKMADLLRRRGAHIHFRADRKGRHDERSWGRRLLPALRFHFGTARAPRP